MRSTEDNQGLPRTPWRRRVLVLLLAVVTAWAVVSALTRHAGEPKRERAAPAAPVVVGGKADVILVAPAPAASAAQ